MANAPADFVFESIGGILVMLHTRKPVADADWAPLVDHLAGRLHARQPLPPGLTLTDGGGPTQAQRQALQKVLDVAQLRTAVVSGASGVRFVVSTLALFSENIRTFPVASVDEAITWLGLSPSGRLELRRGLARMTKAPGAERFETLRAAATTLKL